MKTYAIDPVKVKRLMLDRWGEVEQKRLAIEAGITEQTLIRMFKGHGFSPESLYGICQALSCTPNDVLAVAPKGQILVGVPA